MHVVVFMLQQEGITDDGCAKVWLQTVQLFATFVQYYSATK